MGCDGKSVFVKDLLLMSSNPSQNSLMPELVTTWSLQLRRSPWWSANSWLKDSAFHRLAFSLLWIPDTNTGWTTETFIKKTLITCSRFLFTCVSDNMIAVSDAVTCPCFQQSLNSFQLFWLRWSLSHSRRLLYNQQWGMSGCWLVDSSGTDAGTGTGFFLSGLVSSITAGVLVLLTMLLMLLPVVSGSCLIDSLAVMFWRLAGILFSTTEAMMSSRILGILPLFPVFRKKQGEKKSFFAFDCWYLKWFNTMKQ